MILTDFFIVFVNKIDRMFYKIPPATIILKESVEGKTTQKKFWEFCSLTVAHTLFNILCSRVCVYDPISQKKEVLFRDYCHVFPCAKYEN